MRNKFLTGIALAIPISFLLAAIIYNFNTSDQGDAGLGRGELSAPPAEPKDEELYPFVIPPQSSLYTVLRGHEIDSATIQALVAAAKEYSNLNRIRPGTRYHLRFAPDLKEIHFRFSPVEKLHLQKMADGWVAHKITEKIETEIVTFSSVVKDTLWESAEKVSMDPHLISELSEIFAWQVDFSREVRTNDRWRLSVEKKTVKGQHVGWGSILAAEYQNGGEMHTAFLLRIDGESKGYYSSDGSSLRRMFLKSPIHFARISSRFQKKRFHPILKIHRPHNGVDYAARRGTPVRAVGDGTILLAGRRGGAGNMIKIRHNSTYQTAYLHLQNFAKGIRKGTRVKQGQIIGYVGSTGMSTAPHLHFEFYQNGRFVDPLGRKFPSAEPVAAHLLERFQNEATVYRRSLPPWNAIHQPDASAEFINASSLGN